MQIAMRLSGLLLSLSLALPAVTSAADGVADTALYWTVLRDGEPAGYLLGTIHSEDPRVLDFSESLIEQLGSVDLFAMEMVPDLPTLNRLTEYMHYQDGSTLEDRIGPERFERVRAALSGYRMPPDWIAGMKVWAAMMTLSVPPPQTGLFMDFSLSLRAAGSGLKVIGLETLEEQLSFLESMPMEQQLAPPERVVVLAVAHLVGADVHLDDPSLVVPDFPVGITQVDPAVAQGLHLGAQQHQSGFPGILDLVLVPGPLVLGDDLDPRLLFLLGHFSSMIQPTARRTGPVNSRP